MTSEQIRQAFFDFFEQKGHKILPSAPIVLKDDPTLMFTNAGMNQFKDVFLGNKVPQAARVANTQKCLRVSGKHNDLEEVGMDTYHHTMFEMLGNWSFGDYFKKEAIEWAWELLTEVYKLEPGRLYVTVFGGDPADGTEADTEAENYWHKIVDKDRVIRAGKEDNFWEMGENGPCGPCSEIHVDLRPDAERQAEDATSLINKDHPQVIEIWNLVFVEFNRKKSGKLEKLPSKHIDTGMGFERLAAVIQGKSSNYDTDVFSPLIRFLEKRFSVKYGKDKDTDIAIRVIVDHIRAISFTMADGQMPSNTAAGYVIRRILRRALRYGYRSLHTNEPFLFEMVGTLAEQFKDVFPELFKQSEFISNLIREEEVSFFRTLTSGTSLFEKYIASNIENKKIEGEFAFLLYDTYGFPFDLTKLMANEQGFEVDEAGFEKSLAAQKARSRTDAQSDTGEWVQVSESASHSEFVGYDRLSTSIKILRYRQVETKGKKQYQLIFDKTPFYPEGGGQLGDKGIIKSESESINIRDTFKENDLILHLCEKLPKNPEVTFDASVDVENRTKTEANHSATHLLHAALRNVLGKHVTQKGSLVGPDYLRFDFSHFSKLSQEEVKKIEQEVNEHIRADIKLEEERNVPVQKALKKGAMALFGEKYGDQVRVITFDPEYSVELCGGTHVKATGQIGWFKIVSESAVAAGVRRLEAFTGEKAENYIRQKLDELDAISAILKTKKDIPGNVYSLLMENKELEKQIAKYQKASSAEIAGNIGDKAVEIRKDVRLIAEIVKLENSGQGKDLIFKLSESNPQSIILIGAAVGKKANLWLMADKEICKKYDFNAGKLIGEIAAKIEGGGGGQAFFATAGGKNANGLDEAITSGREIIKAHFKS